MSLFEHWREKADAELLAGLPGKVRTAVEVVFVAVLVLGGHAEGASLPIALGVLGVELVIAIGLVRPWSSASHRSLASRIVATVVAVVTVATPVLVQGPLGSTRRLGVELLPAKASDAKAKGDATPGLPFPEGAVVKSVSPHTPADGVLRPGDHIKEVDGAPLTESDPPDELARRIQSDGLPEDVTLTIERDGQPLKVPVHIPKLAAVTKQLGALNALAQGHVIVATALRDLIFIVFILVLVRVDGQSFRALGIQQEGAVTELGVAVPAIGAVFVVQLAAAIPLAVLGSVAKFGQDEATERIDTLSHLSKQANAPSFLVAILVAATFEEVCFRAFLTPRVRLLTNSWVTSTLLVSALFGLGHVYEGTFAILQTAILGMYFTAVYVLRRRLLAPTVAHATFNGMMFILVQVIAASGAVEKLKALSPH